MRIQAIFHYDARLTPSDVDCIFIILKRLSKGQKSLQAVAGEGGSLRWNQRGQKEGFLTSTMNSIAGRRKLSVDRAKKRTIAQINEDES